MAGLPPSNGLITRLQKWAAHPFTQNLDLLGVALTVGLIVILVAAWRLILGEIVAIPEN